MHYRIFKNNGYNIVTVRKIPNKEILSFLKLQHIENYLKTMNRWLKFNEYKPITKIKLGNRNRRPTIEDERIPNKEELKQILNYADDRGKTSVSLIAFSGLRPETLGNNRGTDGLKIRNFPELEINKAEISFTSVPTKVS